MRRRDGFRIFPLLMAAIKPFAALRPEPKLAARVCELPYDVMSSDEAREAMLQELFKKKQYKIVLNMEG